MWPHLGLSWSCFSAPLHPGLLRTHHYPSPIPQASPWLCPCSLLSRAAASTRRLSRSQAAAAACLPPLQASPCPCPCSLFSRAAASTRRLSRSQTAAACLPPHYRPHLGLVPVLCHLAQHPLGGLGVKQPLHVVQQLALLLSSIIGQEPDKGGKVRCDEVWGVRSVSDKRSRTAAVEEWPTLSKHTAALALACVAFGTI